MNSDVITYYGVIDPKRITILRKDCGDYINPRHSIGDTTDLQDSIKQNGIINPLLVGQNEAGELYLIDGQRRLTAARALKLETVPYVIVDAHGKDIIDLMLASDVREAFPPIVIDSQGNIIGGIASSVIDRLNTQKITKESLARTMGIRPDVVSAYVQLQDAPLKVKQAVAEGRLSITAFARMKYASAELQEQIVESSKPEATISVDNVREHLRQAKNLNVTVSQDDELQIIDLVIACNKLRANIQNTESLGPREQFALQSLVAFINSILG